jgi:hypothetical protein
MGDHYTAIVDLEAQLDKSESLAKKVVNRLSIEGIIQSEFVTEGTSGELGGYRPGNRLPELYEIPPNGYAFWEFKHNLMQAIAGPWVNFFGVPQLEEILCTHCNTKYVFQYAGDPNSYTEIVIKEFVRAMGDFLQGNPQPKIHCPNCTLDLPVTIWATKPHLGFSNLAFVFWNWPQFDSDLWRVDVMKMVSDTLKHPVIITHGKV